LDTAFSAEPGKDALAEVAITRWAAPVLESKDDEADTTDEGYRTPDCDTDAEELARALIDKTNRDHHQEKRNRGE
jgi:hypothetical protein